MIHVVPWVLNLDASTKPNGPTHYHIYANDGAGGPIDYTTPVATVSGLTWTTAPLTAPGSYRFGVRAFGSISLLEEINVDAAVLIELDAAGTDITNRPAAPFGLLAHCEAGGVVVAEWSHPGGTRANAPTGFHVYTGDPTPNYSASVATVAASSSIAGIYRAKLTGLSDGPLSVGVRAFNAVSEESNGDYVSLIVDGTAPDPVDDLVGAATAVG